MSGNIVKSFLRNRDGAAYVMFTLAAVPMLGMAGLATDYIAASSDRSNIKSAIESAALHVAKRIALDPSLSAKAAEEEGKSLVNSILHNGVQYDRFEVDSVTKNVSISAYIERDTTFMRIFGYDKLIIRSKASAAFGIQNIEVAIAIDNSGSMSTQTKVKNAAGNSVTSTRIADAKTAAKALVTAASASVSNVSNAGLKFAVIPWHSNVVVGSEYKNESWVDWDGRSRGHFTYLPPYCTTSHGSCEKGDMYFPIDHGYDTYKGAGPGGNNTKEKYVSWRPEMVEDIFVKQGVSYYAPGGEGIDIAKLKAAPDIKVITRKDVYGLFKNYAWNGCFEHRYGNYRYSNAEPTTAVGDSLFVPYMAPDERAQVNSDKRPTTSYYGKYANTGYDFARNDYLDDLGGDTASSFNFLALEQNQSYSIPDLWDHTRARIVNTPKYARTANSLSVSGSYKYGPNGSCYGAKLLPLTGTTSLVNAKIDEMAANGATDISIGLDWAWQTLTPAKPFVAGNPEDTKKVLVLMTDGQNITGFGGLSQEYMNSYTSLGYPRDNLLGVSMASASSRSDTDTISLLDAATKGYCSAIKNDGITLYFVYFGTPDGDSKKLAANCASSPDTMVIAEDSDALITAFKKIGDDIGKLRLTKYVANKNGK
jgi:hypothetical protein